MSRTKAERWAELHAEAMESFGRIQSALSGERKQCLEDRRFYSIAGAQWEGALGEQFENRPRLEVNKIHLAVIRIINEYRNNRITADFVPKNPGDDDELADVCDGLFRADEKDSGAEEAYDNAFEEAVGGGFGAIRLRADYEDEEDPEDERQRIKIEPIYDADSCVFFDLDARRQDKADAKSCFVLIPMTPSAYEAEYDDSPASWPKDVSASQFDWATPDQVFIAEWYRREEGTDETVFFKSVAGAEITVMASALDEDKLAELEAGGYREDHRKKIRIRKVHKYILSGGGILEDQGIIAGKNIPIVPVYGKRWMVDGIERCQGHVRLAKDAQRLKNMQLSKLAELSAISPVEKPIFTPEQVAGHTTMWAEDSIKNYPYLLVNPITDSAGNVQPAGPLAFTKPPDVPPAMAALLQLTEGDMQAILGNQQEGDKMVSNISGKVVEMIQARMDMQTYIYVSNFAKAIRRVGEVWLSMAREVYVEDGREMKTVEASGEVGKVALQAPAKDPETGGLTTANDLSRAKFDVAVEVGPSSQSRREATVRSITNMLQVNQDPETGQVLTGMAIMNMEGEGIGDVRNYFRRRLVKMGVLKPTEEEAQQMAEEAQASSQPDPNVILANAMAQEAEAKATKARAEVLEIVADTELTHAKTLETLAGIDPAEAQRAAELSGGLAPKAQALEGQV